MAAEEEEEEEEEEAEEEEEEEEEEDCCASMHRLPWMIHRYGTTPYCLRLEGAEGRTSGLWPGYVA